jgi:benzaldehyde dehydrogenase (NAD)
MARDMARDMACDWRVAQRIESGMCQVNGPTVHDEAQMPFGDLKGSGSGLFGRRAGIEAFTELRWISLQKAPWHCPF